MEAVIYLNFINVCPCSADHRAANLLKFHSFLIYNGQTLKINCSREIKITVRKDEGRKKKKRKSKVGVIFHEPAAVIVCVSELQRYLVNIWCVFVTEKSSATGHSSTSGWTVHTQMQDKVTVTLEWLHNNTKTFCRSCINICKGMFQHVFHWSNCSVIIYYSDWVKRI